MPNRREVLKKLAGAAAAVTCGAAFGAGRREEHPARFWSASGNRLRCELCPNGCLLPEGKTGLCRNRRNKSGAMVTLGYGYPCASNVDPIEKKPLYHFLPGSLAYSFAVAGCNLRCKNCQNYGISQASPLETDVPYKSPGRIVDEAKKSGARSIAYTYSEPTVWFEYMYDTAKLARKAGLKNVMVTSGFINREPLGEIAQFLDGAHIDLKSFDDTIYRNLNAGALQPVLDAIVTAKRKGVWVEIINLVVPKWTDDFGMIRTMARWIGENAGFDTPLHFSRFFPLYQLAALYPTPAETLRTARNTALGEKLRYVYIGNAPEADSNTYCPDCASLLIQRTGYRITVKGMKGPKCGKCAATIPGVWAG